jgi:CRISPR system Cascade subunit CasE
MPGIELSERLGLNALRPGAKFRYRLRANTSKTDILTGKRLGLFKTAEQTDWLSRQGVIRGFSVFSAHLSQSGLLEGKRNAGGGIKVYAVLFDGVLETTDPAKFKQAVADGIGHAKAMGLGLLSVIPLKE